MDFSRIQLPQGGPSTPSRSAQNAPGFRDDPAMIRDMLLANPDQLAQLQQSNSALAEAVLSGSLDQFATVLRRQYAEKHQAEQQKMKLLSSSPFDSEAQRLIAEEIRRKNIEGTKENRAFVSLDTKCCFYFKLVNFFSQHGGSNRTLARDLRNRDYVVHQLQSQRSSGQSKMQIFFTAFLS